MTLDQFRSYADRGVSPFVTAAKRLGLTPDAVSAIAAVVGVSSGVAFYLAGTSQWLYLLAAFLVVASGWLDLVDGELARDMEVGSPAGDLLDHVADRYADIAVFVGVAAGVERYALGLAAITGVLMTSYLGTQAQAVGLDRVYGGVVGRADRLAVTSLAGVATAVVGTGWTQWGLSIMGWLLVFIAVVGHLTALQRFYYSMRALSGEDR